MSQRRLRWLRYRRGSNGSKWDEVALELYKAFQRAKDVAYARARQAQSIYLYFPGSDFQAQAAVLGDDPFPINLRAMRKNVERAIQGSVEQGLLTRSLKIEDIYYRTTLMTCVADRDD